MENKEDIKQKDMQHYFLWPYTLEYSIRKFLNQKETIKDDIRKLEPIFRSFKLNSRILKITDVIVTKFLEDTVVDDEIELANTKHNFFSQHVWNDTMLRVIDKKIRQEEDEIVSLKKLVNSLF